jgi:hypothetical protein
LLAAPRYGIAFGIDHPGWFLSRRRVTDERQRLGVVLLLWEAWGGRERLT